MSSLTSVNESSFGNEVLDAGVPVLVDFWASWCGYCNRMTPVLEEVAEESSGKIKIVKVNVDENKSLAQKYNVMSLPTMILFKDGKPAETIIGYSPKGTINSKISPHL